jgi:hypothetical protein
MLISQLKHELEEFANFIGEADGSMERASRENESCRRLLAVPGIGPVTATTLIAAVGKGSAFRKGREFSRLGGDGAERILYWRKAKAEMRFSHDIHPASRKVDLRLTGAVPKIGSGADVLELPRGSAPA